ncbi:2-phosphosulfolactate phosphatase [Paenibacillus sp. NPDC058174]|uniref:2-phosphosulfolactate phosphatase n=1 Tax=Paenibacillus sp. NPDC058174 TaxID=3346366 RepID=UPI0036DADB68
MRVQVISSVNEASSAQFHHKTALIVDVLCASSAIVTALAAGSIGVVPVETVLEARAARQTGDLLGGERFCRKIPGFDLGSSPDEYTSPEVRDRKIILTTTNGTRAIVKSAKADFVLAGALLNASACAKAALELRRDIVILCAGSNDEFALEDGLCAGLLLERLQGMTGGALELDDFGCAMLALYGDRSHAVKETIQQGMTGKKLLKLGLRKDLESCAAIDRYQEVPRLYGDMLISNCG